MKYSTQAFLFRNKIRKPYDPFMDIATEKFSHLVTVGCTITMLLDGDDDVEMTNDRCDWTRQAASRFPRYGYPTSLRQLLMKSISEREDNRDGDYSG